MSGMISRRNLRIRNNNPTAYAAAWDLVEELAFARQHRHRTALSVAEEAGITRAMISLYECGHNLPGLPGFVAWARALGYRVVLEEIDGD